MWRLSILAENWDVTHREQRALSLGVSIYRVTQIISNREKLRTPPCGLCSLFWHVASSLVWLSGLYFLRSRLFLTYGYCRLSQLSCSLSDLNLKSLKQFVLLPLVFNWPEQLVTIESFGLTRSGLWVMEISYLGLSKESYLGDFLSCWKFIDHQEMTDKWDEWWSVTCKRFCFSDC